MAHTAEPTPDVCLLSIFDSLPILDLVRINRISPQWAKLRMVACRRRTSLTILIGDPILDDDPLDLILKSTFPDNRPSSASIFRFNYRSVTPEVEVLYPDAADRILPKWRHPWFHRRTVIPLRILFPKVTNLSIAIRLPDLQDIGHCLVPLLTAWHRQLESLSLRLHFTTQRQEAANSINFKTVMTVINKLPALKRLTLEYPTSLNLSAHKLTIFESVEQLYVASTNSHFFEQIIESSKSRRDGHPMKRLGYDKELSHETLRRLTAFRPPSSSLVTLPLPVRHLNVNVEASIDNLKKFCETFTHLEYLRVTTLENPTLAELTDALAPLEQLRELRLIAKWSHKHVGLLEFGAPLPGPPLKSVKRLWLDVHIAYHTQLHSLEQIFPSLESLRIIHCSRGCISCRFTLTDEELGTNCQAAIVRPWIDHCGRLKEVLTVYDGNETVWPTKPQINEIPKVFSMPTQRKAYCANLRSRGSQTMGTLPSRRKARKLNRSSIK